MSTKYHVHQHQAILTDLARGTNVIVIGDTPLTWASLSAEAKTRITTNISDTVEAFVSARFFNDTTRLVNLIS